MAHFLNFIERFFVLFYSKKLMRCLLGSAFFLLLFIISINGYAQVVDRGNLTKSVRAPVWAEELGEVSLDEYTPEELKKMVHDYWTPERMRNAIPADVLSLDDFSQLLLQNQDVWIGEQQFVPVTFAALRASGEAGAPNGRVFYRNVTDGENYSCSGSAINSSSKRLVATAGHCIHGGGLNKTWHQNWWFVPNYYHLHMPQGMFTAHFMRTFEEWTIYGQTGIGFANDLAFVTTNDNLLSQRVVDAVGGHGLVTGGNYSFNNENIKIYGYPWGIDTAQSLQTCSLTTGLNWMGSIPFHSAVGCFFGGGASGGPWVSHHNNITGVGLLRSVSSWRTGGNLTINGPYFYWEKIAPFYNIANSDWP